MTIIIGTDPSKALASIDSLEKEIARFLGRSSSKGIKLDRIKNAIGDANEVAIRYLADDLQYASPRWTGFLVSRWTLEEGPGISVTPEFPEFTYPGAYTGMNAGGSLDGIDLDGFLPLHVVNDAWYAGDVADGAFPGVSAPLDWYQSLEQLHASGTYFKSAIKTVTKGAP